MNMMLGVIAVCLDIAILVALGTNPYYSAEVRWACFALVALLSLPPLLWLFGGHIMELETKWQHHCRARAAAAHLKNGR